MATFTYEIHAAMPAALRGGVLTIGNFDGVHLGHQTLLAEAARQGRPAVAVTFDPHVSHVLRPDRVEPPLTTLEERISLLYEFGVDHVLILRTTLALLQLSAREFFEQILIERLAVKAMVEGFNFAFGRGREGTTEVLQRLCDERSVPLTLIPPCEVDGQPVSSTRVRADVLAGAVDVVQQLLGRPYRITGVVGTGQKRGQTLGFPTANLHDVQTLVPGNGVYAVRATILPSPTGSEVGGDGMSWPAAANVGPNPTFGENARKIEVHLIGFSGDIYGQILNVDFVKQIRATRAFGSAQELIAQIQIDIDSVRKVLA